MAHHATHLQRPADRTQRAIPVEVPRMRLRNTAVLVVVGGVLLFNLTGLSTWVSTINQSGQVWRAGAADQTDDALTRQLDEKLRVLSQCIDAKAVVARELAVGRITLFKATARVRLVDQRNPYFNWEEFRRGIPAACDDERHCREVIERLLAVLPEGPVVDALVARYTAELQEHLDLGTLRLTNPGTVDEKP